MHVALTGASGFVGRAIAECLLRNGHTVRLSARSQSALPTHGASAQVVEGDLRTAEVRRQLVEGVDVLVHCAAALRTSDQFTLFEMNVHVTAELAEAAHVAGVSRVVLLSSTGVYGQQGGELDETSPHRPDSAYEQSKSAGEAAAASSLPPGVLTIVRPSNVVGEAHPGQPLLRLLRRLRDGTIVYSRTAHANYVHVDDVADVVVQALSPEAPPTVNVNDAVPLCQFAAAGRKALGVAARRDRILPAMAGQILAVALERNRHRNPAFSRAMALVDDTRITSLHRTWARGAISPQEAITRTLERLASSYQEAGLL